MTIFTQSIRKKNQDCVASVACQVRDDAAKHDAASAAAADALRGELEAARIMARAAAEEHAAKVAELQQQCSDVAAAAIAAEARRGAEAAGERHQLMQQLAAAEAQCKHLTMEVELMRAQSCQLQDCLDTVSQDLHAAQQQGAEHEARAACLVAELAAMQVQVTQLQAALDHADEARRMAGVQLADVEAQHAATGSKQEEARRTLELQLQQAFGDAAAQRELLKSAEQQHLAATAVMATQLADMQASITRLKADEARLQALLADNTREADVRLAEAVTQARGAGVSEVSCCLWTRWAGGYSPQLTNLYARKQRQINCYRIVYCVDYGLHNPPAIQLLTNQIYISS